MSLLLLFNQGQAVAPSQASGAAPAQPRPWPRAAVRRALMVAGEGVAQATGYAAMGVRYPNGSRSPGAPRSVWTVPAAATGQASSFASARVTTLRRVAGAGVATSAGKLSASVWQDDAAEILALVAALDLARQESNP